MRYLRLPMFLVALLGLTMVTAGDSAQAGQIFGPNTPEGFVSGLSGASEFGLPDSTAGSITCPLCDSVVNFTAYSNPDRSDWREDIAALKGVDDGSWEVLANDPLAEGGDKGNPWDDRWVFFYQIQNTNPLGGVNADLENFNVTKTWYNGDPFVRNAYANGGFNDGQADISPFSETPGLDVPNNWIPSEFGEQMVVPGIGGQDPLSLSFTNATGPNPIASAAVRAGQEAYSGALFEFGPLGDDQINPLEFSDVLWLSSNAPTAGIIWAETESPGGFGAAGDVAGIKNVVPEPSSMAIWSLIGFAGMARFRRRKN